MVAKGIEDEYSIRVPSIAEHKDGRVELVNNYFRHGVRVRVSECQVPLSTKIDELLVRLPRTLHMSMKHSFVGFFFLSFFPQATLNICHVF